MKTLELILPWPPSSNTLYATVNSRRVLSRAGRAYKRAVAQQVNYHQSPLTCRLAVYIRLTEPDRRRRDIANVEKIVMDSLQDAGVIQDDSQIDELYISRRGVSKNHPCVRVMLQEYLPANCHRSIEEIIRT